MKGVGRPRVSFEHWWLFSTLRSPEDGASTATLTIKTKSFSTFSEFTQASGTTIAMSQYARLGNNHEGK